MNYWLMKSEPQAFSIDDLARRGREPWDGVRNYQARNFMRDGMQVGDKILFYHSNCKPPGIAGIAEVVSPAYPDPSQFDPTSDHFDAASPRETPRWVLVEVGFIAKLPQLLSLDELRTHPELSAMPLLRKGNRLSVLPVSATEWDFIQGLI